MLSEEEKKAIEKLEEIREQTIRANECGLSNNDFKEEIEVYNTVLNLITKLQKENEEKDKIIYEIARSNVKLKGYEIEEKYIDTTIRFFTKYVKNLERNPQWRNDKNE